MLSKNRTKIIWAIIFSISFAFIQFCSIYYLRLSFSRTGIDYPLKFISNYPQYLEYLREVFSVAMIFCFASIITKRFKNKFAYFMIIFGLWDIFYYLWFYLFTGWPETLLSWDLLFKIPVPWVGPVIAPIIVSITLILCGAIILNTDKINVRLQFPVYLWVVEIFAGIIVILSFTMDYKYALNNKIPDTFHWNIFVIGLLIGIIGFIIPFYRRYSEGKKL